MSKDNSSDHPESPEGLVPEAYTTWKLLLVGAGRPNCLEKVAKSALRPGYLSVDYGDR